MDIKLTPVSIFFFVTIACLIAYCDSSTFILPNAPHAAHMGKCYHQESGIAVKPGQIIEILNHCVQLYCQKNLVFAGVGCPSVETFDENCHEIPGDLRLTYPYCCPRFRCVDLDGRIEIF
ncbi:hypothetical protein Bhyg_14572 [Pseudolycoriella hygida]|uniref:Single domain-containing protein n=1 Tax=Pseudolycoriella hygida TaxID=35572 RepID=A0A9Q0MQE0_9DIPT|nr:hypothetical protein Bhyg_14572 [Pseudolycoriella hygida]